MKTMTYIINLVVFALCTQFVFADAPDWEDTPGAYEFTASMVAVVHNEGDQLDDPADILAAFDASGNVRGIATSLYAPFGDYAGTNLWDIQLRANADGDAISFKYYDASIDAVLDIIEGYTFSINDVIGSVNGPHELTAGVSYPTAPDCSDNDAGVAPFDCASAVASFGCDFNWGGAPIGDSCPVTCGSCPEYNEGCMDSSAANYDENAEYHDGNCLVVILHGVMA